MSYILEALRKAEAERRSGAVPDIHAAPAFAASAASEPSRRWRWSWFAVPALLAVAAAVWLMKEPATTASAAPPVAAITAAPPPPPPPLPAPPEILETPPPVAIPARKKEKPPAKEPLHKSRAVAEDPKPETAGTAVTLAELPSQIQRELPALAIGGYIYSGNKAERSILINKRLLREGDEVAPGLRLETMTPSGMILSYKGYRYRRSYQ